MNKMKIIMQTKLYEFGFWATEEQRYHLQTKLTDWGLKDAND